MDVLIFGATGMVGQGVLRECLRDPGVRRIFSIGRTPSGRQEPKLTDVVVKDLFDLSALDLSSFDACFYCLGVSSNGMTEEAYSRITYELTMSIATALVRSNPQMTFVFVSGTGTDSTESGRIMWARVKGRAENGVMRMPFKASYMFRPAFIQPLHGIRSKTKLYQFFYTLTGPLMPILKRIIPRSMTTTEQIGWAMLAAARTGAPKRILETDDINRL